MNSAFHNHSLASLGLNRSLHSADFTLEIAVFAGQSSGGVLYSSMNVISSHTPPLTPQDNPTKQCHMSFGPHTSRARLQVTENTRSIVAKVRPPSPLVSILTKNLYRKSFVSHTYKKQGVAPLPFWLFFFLFRGLA